MKMLQVMVVGAPDIVQEDAVQIRVHRVPRREALHDVAVGHDARHAENHLVHHLEVPARDEVLQLHALTYDHQHEHHHRESGEDGTGNEVGREDRHVPAGHDRGGKVE
jgi:chromosome condensin MukBEF MukE localization factor